jgi:uncharacterized protein (TIGR02145 family)
MKNILVLALCFLLGNLQAQTSTERKSWLNPSISYDKVTDIDGNAYATIQIGTQVWMAENLRTSRYQNGDTIPNVQDSSQWNNLTTGAWCHYDNNPKLERPYGKLYNWYTVSDPRKVCPTGWHVPTDAEWAVVIDYLGGEDVAGLAMKSKGRRYWEANEGTTNASGFSALPGGCRNYVGGFVLREISGSIWAVTESDPSNAFNYSPSCITDGMHRDTDGKTLGNAVRCLKD